MVVNTPKKSLPKGEGTDSARDYLKGSIGGGGLWRALEILDNAVVDTLADAKGDLFAGTAADAVGRLAVGANDTSLIADSSQATGLRWAALGTTQLAANAATQSGRSAGTGGSTTTSTTYVDLPAASVALTTVGGELLAWLVAPVASTAVGGGVRLALSLDAAAEVGEQFLNAPVANYYATFAVLYRFTGVAAGAHTVKARWKTDVAGTLTVGVPQLLVVELKR